MFIVNLTYLNTAVPSAALVEHRQYLDRFYTMEIFLAAGPKSSSGGDIILVNGAVTPSELNAILADDPLLAHQAVAHQVTEFEPIRRHPVLNYVL